MSKQFRDELYVYCRDCGKDKFVCYLPEEVSNVGACAEKAKVCECGSKNICLGKNPNEENNGAAACTGYKISGATPSRIKII